ncbi:MAG: TniQ family protein [Roseobacter sp.]|uniref:TniQ family protein n=1 Tax=Tateyamaria sp. TaxID=1929288 RepID=UPI00327D36CE
MTPKPLPLRPEPNDEETILSFLSRLAAMNGVTAKNFAEDNLVKRQRWAYLRK